MTEHANQGASGAAERLWAAFRRSGRIADYLLYRRSLPHTEGEADVRNRKGPRHP